MLDLAVISNLSWDLKLLYVEDNSEARESTMTLLEDFFENITIGIDGVDGLEKFKANSYDLVITDINMPKLDGLVMAEKIKEIDSDIPILVISAHQEIDFFINSIKIGIDGYLFKPLDIEQFSLSLSKICKSFNDKKEMELLREKLEKRSNRRIEQIISHSDKQGQKLRQLNKELDEYKNHLEDKVKIATLEIVELNKELEDTQKEVVFTMGAIGESRSKETGNHVKRVAEYSKLLALYYGLSEEESELIKQASPMHDIGKIAIPDSILNKPGRFDHEEFEIMKSHAQLGYDMISQSSRPLLKAASILAFQHHERFDGKGYPRGLVGYDIHIYGRITALADVFDALGSERCYKKIWSDEKIFKLFKEERGAQFDPKLIDIFFENLDEFLAIRDNFQDENII